MQAMRPCSRQSATQVYIEWAKGQYQKSFAKLQQALPIIEKNETITFKDGRTGSYAPNDEIQEIVGPICRQFGFTLSFATTYPAPGMVKVTGELAHKDGHSKFSEYEARVDMSGGKTDAQGRGSVMSYGHRYTTVDLLNLIQRGADSDGSVDVPPEDTTPKPEGYRDFENSLRSAAMVGMMDLGHAWSNGTNALRTAVPNSLWVDLKAVAEARDAVL
ncbi:MAG: hypothetical protein EBS84_20115 [Proteobacteria bacterium]|nr:hypothetical protein [Pseudomonadota bacterium]